MPVFLLETFLFNHPTTFCDRYSLSPIVQEGSETWKDKELAWDPEMLNRWGNGCSESSPFYLSFLNLYCFYIVSGSTEAPLSYLLSSLSLHQASVKSKAVSVFLSLVTPHGSWIHWPMLHHLHPSGDFQICLDPPGVCTSVHQIRVCEMLEKLQMLGETQLGETRIQSKPRPAGSPQRSPRHGPEALCTEKKCPRETGGKKRKEQK